MVTFKEAATIAAKKREDDDQLFGFLDALTPEQKELLRSQFIKIGIGCAMLECFFTMAFLYVMYSMKVI